MEAEYITHKQFDSALKRIERKNLKANGKSLSWVSMSNSCRDLVIELQDDKNIMIVKAGWRKELKQRFTEA